jgi:prenylcysteine oxidase/farnesylcysteine lyase
MLSEDLSDRTKLVDAVDRESNSNLNQKVKIAIIGGGISGCSCAFFLRQLFENQIDVTVFEKTNQIGGRLRTIEYNDRKYELGGSILHPSNLYMKSFLKICDLEKTGDSNSDYVALFDKQGIIIEKTGKYFGLFDKLRFVNRYGLLQLYKLENYVNKFVKQFSKIYKLQDSGFTFLTLSEFLNKIGPKLFAASQQSLRSLLQSEKFSERLINEMASIACLANYGQTVDIDGFVGLVSLAGVTGDLWAVKSGNCEVARELLKRSQAKIMLNTTIKLICKDKDNEESKNLITYDIGDNTEASDSFDYVIIAFPIYNNIIGNNFQLDFENSHQFDKLNMQLTNTYFIYGTVKLFSHLPYNKHIQLHSIDPSIPFRTVCVNLPCDYDPKENKGDADLYLKGGNKLYKIFAEVNLDAEIFAKIFETGYEMVCVEPWLAYPKYSENPSSKTIPDVILDGQERSRVFYLNALEWSSSCMEISVISARNTALLIAGKENVIKDKRRINYSNNANKSQEFNTILNKVCGVFSVISIVAFLLSVYFNQ